MRILIVSQYFWPENFRINDLAQALLQRGHQITVLTGKPNYPGGIFFTGYGIFGRKEENYCGIRIIRVPLIPRGHAGKVRLAANYLSFALSASLLGPLRCRGHFDVIFAYEPSPITVGIPARLLKSIKRAPLLLWVQDLWPESVEAAGAVRSRLILGVAEWITRAVYRGCDLILVQSRAFIEAVARMGVAEERIRYYPNSVETMFHPLRLDADAPERARLPVGFRIMFAGNIGAAQDFATILAAAEMLKSRSDIHWIIIGDGRQYGWIVAEVARRGLRDIVHLLGRHPLESMPRYFALADVMLVTLKKEPVFSLTVPTKVQAYLACAKPIVAALDGEGARVLMESGAGIAVEPENPAMLAQAVHRLADTPAADRHAMGENGLAYFRAHFDRSKLVEELEGLMQNLTGG